jgi:single-strand DNA-binding protein
MSRGYFAGTIKVTIARDPELRQTSNGGPMCSAVIAYNDNSGSDQKADFITVMLFGKNAEDYAKYKKKGEEVIFAVSRLKLNTYQARDGEMKAGLSFTGHGMNFIDRGSPQGQQPNGYNQGYQQKQQPRQQQRPPQQQEQRPPQQSNDGFYDGGDGLPF